MVRFFIICICSILFLNCFPAFSQSQVNIFDDSIVLSNSFTKRVLSVTPEGVHTTAFINRNTGTDYSRMGSEEFSIRINKNIITGKNLFQAFTVEKILTEEDPEEFNKLQIQCTGIKEGIGDGITLKLEYRIYDQYPVIRKFIHVENNSDTIISLSDLDVECLKMVPGSDYLVNVYSNYGTSLMRIPYQGDYYDPALLVYNENTEEGFILGNEAPSILKRTDIFTERELISIGMKYLSQPFPFKKFLMPGESFSSPGTFICLYNGSKWQDAFEDHFIDFVRNSLNVRLFEKSSYPLFYYCTWNPFRYNINEKLIIELADSLEGTGVDVLIIDDGWQDNRGDWNPHPERFPNGMLRVCDYIRSKGMKPGLWFTIATIDKESQVYQEHPEWAVLDSSGRPTDLHSPHWENHITMSMDTKWYEYILEKLSLYIQTCKLGYVKLDFAVANSAYVMEPVFSGDYGFEGKTYKDHESSYYSIYDRTIDLLDELNKRFPRLIVDCTFEVWGRYNISDFALIQHADVSWLTNYEFDPPRGPISIRQVLDERFRTIPPATMLIGNQLMISDNHEFTFHSVASANQLLCGDIRCITPEQKAWYRKWTSWYREMEEKYQYTRFYQKSDVFDKPGMENWDGCYRFNPDKEGGILFFYRNNSPDESRIFRIHCVNDETSYLIYDPMTKKELGIYTGVELKDKGIPIRIDALYTAKVVGIEKKPL